MGNANDIKKQIETTFHDKEVDPNIKASLVINEGEKTATFELLNFTTEFIQEVDYKGEPLHTKKGGLFSFTLDQPSNYFFNHWALSRDMVAHSGKFLFRNPDASSSPSLIIAFKNAVCISYIKEISPANDGIILKLIISPQSIKFGEIDFNNGEWE